MRARVACQGLALAGAAALTLSLAAAPASGASTPGWRVVTTIGTTTAGGSWLTRFSVTGAGTAWSAWTERDSAGAATGFVVQRWTGRTWAAANVSASQLPLGEASIALGSASGSDAWIIDAPNSKSASVLRWNGSSWTSWAIPARALVWNESNVYRTVPVFFSATDVWIFNLGPGYANGIDISRYNGRKWTTLGYAGIPDQVSIDSRTDIWMYGANGHVSSKNSSYALMRWNGSRWLTVQLAKSLLSYPLYGKYLVAVGPKDVYLSENTSSTQTQRLLNWNGRSLQPVALPAQLSVVDSMTKDGHGGIWVYGTGPQGQQYFADRNGGKWTVDAVPDDNGGTASTVTGLNWIPGTRSVWATAEYPGSGGTVAAILKFGP
jgi:hypothetical protein